MAAGGKLWKKTLGDAVAPGDVIDGKYRLDRVTGAGGMGVVLEAHHVELDGRVAVKLLRIDHDTEAAHARFRREAKAAFQLTSEHVARILDLGEHEEAGLYMVMEFLDGPDLSQLLVRHGQLPIGTAVGYILQVCEAVAEAHSLGIVHRDLKPENILVCRRADGSPCAKVIDFGLAKVENRVQSLTGMNRGLGTPRYMSPEQWVSARDVGAAADIWALGVILFELVTARTPFPDEDINDLCQAVIAGPVPRASEAEPTLPKGIDDIISKCLQKKPSQRYQSATELAAALLPFAQLSASTTTSTIRPPVPSPMWMMSDADVGEQVVTQEATPPVPRTEDVTTVDNAEVGHAHERVQQRRSSDEWLAAPIAQPTPPRRSPLVIGAAAAAGLAVVSVVAMSITNEPTAPPEPQLLRQESAETIEPPARPTILAPIESPKPAVVPPPAPVPRPEPTPPPPTEPMDDPPGESAPEPDPEPIESAPPPAPPPWRPPPRRKKSEWKPPPDL